MVSEHKKYLMQTHAKADKKQSRLSADGKLQIPTIQVTTQFKDIDFTMKVMCPFCLYAGKLQEFLISAKYGVSHHKAHCPECRTVMMMKSLTADMTPEQYADWVYPYANSGFWQKCKFETWKKRLSQIGWAQRFWDRYKALKGSDETESYTDYIERKSQEDAQEQYNRYVDDNK